MIILLLLSMKRTTLKKRQYNFVGLHNFFSIPYTIQLLSQTVPNPSQYHSNYKQNLCSTHFIDCVNLLSFGACHMTSPLSLWLVVTASTRRNAHVRAKVYILVTWPSPSSPIGCICILREEKCPHKGWSIYAYRLDYILTILNFPLVWGLPWQPQLGRQSFWEFLLPLYVIYH